MITCHPAQQTTSHHPSRFKIYQACQVSGIPRRLSWKPNFGFQCRRIQSVDLKEDYLSPSTTDSSSLSGIRHTMQAFTETEFQLPVQMDPECRPKDDYLSLGTTDQPSILHNTRAVPERFTWPVWHPACHRLCIHLACLTSSIPQASQLT